YVDESGRVLDVPVTTSGTPADPTVWQYDSTIDRWEQADLPDPGPFGDAVRRVVLVAEDDALNVRVAAGGANEVIGMVAPGTVVGLNGPESEIDSSTWVEMASPVGPGWVDSYFLAEVVADESFSGDDRVITLVDRMAEIIRERGDLAEVPSRRGLYVSHHAAPTRFSPQQLRGVLADPTTYRWPSNALDDDDLSDAADEIERTFTEAVGDSFAGSWDDPDRVYAHDEPLTGGNGRLPDAAIPFVLSGFHYLSVFDSGDDADHRGMDWTSWHIAIDYEDAAPVVIGLTLDQWAP
ncbi:MAG: hypothetical protein OEV40_31665, partial [Acidimicrobiia bacterium]|nr:hypothetical protein [Acidimicrobiia bacterium]